MITYLIGFLSLQPMWILAGQIHVLPLQRFDSDWRTQSPVHKAQSATIDAPSVLTETIDAQYEDGWVT